MPSMANTHGGVLYYVLKVPAEDVNRMESGWDNPFRPGGDLSREADEIVELIKGGKPITPTSAGGSPIPPPNGDLVDSVRAEKAAGDSLGAVPPPPAASSTPRTAKNGKTVTGGETRQIVPTSPAPGANNVDVQRGTASAPTGEQVEHVIIKKKPKCKCCVIQ